MEEKLRIYVGGLGASVMEGDLKKTFTSPLLGTVESVEIIRSKGRSFAYLDFVPASEKGLSKLFSAYNGCLWKGGRLKLEKAKEHYLFRLKREWTEDSELAIKLASQNMDLKENLNTLQTTKKNLDTEQMQLRIFFPKLRKIKPVPLKGTGKHKYSFQRVEIPPLPIHFCDCEEHSVPPVSAKKFFSNDRETATYGVDEEELDMMKSVLNKFLEGENSSKAVSIEARFNEEIYPGHSVDNLEVGGNEEDQVSDEDGLVINMLSRPSNRVALFTNRGQETTTTKQDSLLRKPQTLTGSRIREIHGSQERKLVPGNKRKAFLSTVDANVTVPSKKKVKNGHPYDAVDDLQIAGNTQTTETERGAANLSCDMANSKKPVWKDLVNQKERAMFCISDVLTDHNPEVEIKSRFDRLNPPPFIEKDRQESQSSKDKESENLSDIQPIKPKVVEDHKSTRGSSWLQKSSWLQLVGDADKSSFNLAQILPAATLGNQKSPQFDGNNASSSRNTEKQKSSTNDIKYPVEKY